MSIFINAVTSEWMVPLIVHQQCYRKLNGLFFHLIIITMTTRCLLKMAVDPYAKQSLKLTDNSESKHSMLNFDILINMCNILGWHLDKSNTDGSEREILH